ncbi:MAG: SDR family oxidoreductase [Alphaproteobacteria bacterium]|nr:SDR family oxidoreductase [Alphaproteobacteria bacterium]
MARLDGRVAIVTGAAQGIGATYAKSLAAEGAKIVATDVLDTAAVVGVIKQAGGEAVGLKADVTSDADCAAMVAKAVQTYGKLDILVNNAALFGALSMRGFMDIPEEEWDRVMRVNIRGSWQCAKAAVPAMQKNKYGKIINIASGTVFKGTPMLLHYVTSKGAIVAMTRALAREVGDHNICVNALAPGLTASEAVAKSAEWATAKVGNIGTRAFKREEVPEDLIGAMLFLCSKDSDFMTGQTIVVDGGSVMH